MTDEENKILKADKEVLRRQIEEKSLEKENVRRQLDEMKIELEELQKVDAANRAAHLKAQDDKSKAFADYVEQTNATLEDLRNRRIAAEKENVRLTVQIAAADREIQRLKALIPTK